MLLYHCDIKRNLYLVFVLSSWPRASKTLGISQVIRVSGIAFVNHCKPLQLPVYVNEVISGKSLRMGWGWLPRELTTGFQLLFELEEGVAGDWSSIINDVI